MKKQQKLLVVATTLIFSILLGSHVCFAEDKQTPDQGKVFAPEFTLLDLAGKEVTSQSLKGKVVVIHFWATWCYYCRKEVPLLNELYAKYKKQDVVILAVSLDRDGPAAVLAMQKKLNINYPIVMGNRNIQKDFGNFLGLPTTFILNSDWQIIRKHQGYVAKAVLENSIKDLLKKTPKNLPVEKKTTVTLKQTSKGVQKKQPPAPDFTLLDLNGKEVTSQSLKGKVVLIHFWASWCHYCRKEIPLLNELYAKYKNQGVTVLAISLDRTGPKTVLNFQKQTRIKYPIVMGNRKTKSKFGNIRGLPTTFIINSDWQITGVHPGYVPKAVLENSIKKLLKPKS